VSGGGCIQREGDKEGSGAAPEGHGTWGASPGESSGKEVVGQREGRPTRRRPPRVRRTVGSQSTVEHGRKETNKVEGVTGTHQGGTGEALGEVVWAGSLD
jgi:hypothetical protein